MKLTFYPVDSEPLTFNMTQSSFVVGRSPSCDVALVLEGISRQHCKIEFRDNDIYITDLGSTNGVFIDGRRIVPKQPVRYQTFLPLQIGGVPSVQIELPDTKNYLMSEWMPVDIPAKERADENLTRTRTITPKKFKELASKAPAPKAPESSSKLVQMVALLILAGGIYLFFAYARPTNDDSADPEAAGQLKSVKDNGYF